jgi:hypothetical protein
MASCSTIYCRRCETGAAISTALYSMTVKLFTRTTLVVEFEFLMLCVTFMLMPLLQFVLHPVLPKVKNRPIPQQQYQQQQQQRGKLVRYIYYYS